MKKIKISKGYILMFWSPLGDGPELDGGLSGLNLNNIDSINKLVQELLLPEYKNWPAQWQFNCKESLKYAICFASDKELERYYNVGLPQISLPTSIPIREFYIYIWKFMFNEEGYEISNPDLYEIISEYEIYK